MGILLNVWVYRTFDIWKSERVEVRMQGQWMLGCLSVTKFQKSEFVVPKREKVDIFTDFHPYLCEKREFLAHV
jgi:hypothetical protein